jgi:hypothetical protein
MIKNCFGNTAYESQPCSCKEPSKDLSMWLVVTLIISRRKAWVGTYPDARDVRIGSQILIRKTFTRVEGHNHLATVSWIWLPDPEYMVMKILSREALINSSPAGVQSTRSCSLHFFLASHTQTF